jgi:DNA primase
MSGPSVAGSPRTARGSDDWIERVRAASDIVELVGQTVALKRVGRNWVGLCPFHKEKRPSFSVNAERQFYHCFGCKAGGDVFRFVQDQEKVGFLEAAELLSRRAGIPVPDLKGGAPGEKGARARLLEALETAATAYEQWLGDPEQGAAARGYLERRGITREMQREFRLGLAPPGWESLTRRLGARVPDEVLVGAGLAARRETERGGLYDRFRNRLIVPLVIPGGAVVGFGARALAEEDNPKYLNSPETAVYHKSAFLFGLDQARRHVEPDGEVIVVEGYFDTIALHQAGLRHTVATSGTALTSEQARLLKRVAARVALTYDGDAAGREAMMRSLSVLMAEGLDVVIVDLPQGEDPDTLLRRGGVEAWNEARARAADPVEFIQRHVLRVGGAGDPRERALQATVSLVVAIPDLIRRRLLIERASQVFGLSESVLSRAVALRGQGQDSARPLRAAVTDVRRGEQHVERRLIELLMHHPEALDDVRTWFGPEDFRDPGCRSLAEWLWSGRPGLPEEEPAGSFARELVASAPETADWKDDLQVAMRLMRRRNLLSRMKEIEQMQKKTVAEDEALQLARESGEIARSLHDLSS